MSLRCLKVALIIALFSTAPAHADECDGLTPEECELLSQGKKDPFSAKGPEAKKEQGKPPVRNPAAPEKPAQKPTAEESPAAPPQIANEKPQTPPGETPPNESPQNKTGIRQGDVIIMRQNQEQVRVWNEQQDLKSMEARLQYEGRHGQNIQIEQPQGYTTPQVMGEVTDAKGNVWERVKVNAQDVPQYLGKNGGNVYVLSVGGPEQAEGKKLQAGEVGKEGETLKTPPPVVTGVPAKTEVKAETAAAPVAVTTFFKGLSDKMVNDGRAADKARELASVEDATNTKAVEKIPAPKQSGDIALNNDIQIGSSGGVADMSATGTVATELFRLKQKGANGGTAPQGELGPQVLTAGMDPARGDKLGAEQKGLPKRALASTDDHTVKNTFKNLIAVLAGIVTIFLLREIGFFNKLKLATSAGRGRAFWLAASQFANQFRKALPTGKPTWLAGGKKKKTSHATNATSATKMKRKA